MTTTGRRTATSAGQPRQPAPAADPSLRSRVRSGIRTRGDLALSFSAHLLDLDALLTSIGEPSWACGPTAAALHGFDGFPLTPPYHVVVPRGRFVNRIGHVVHTTSALDGLDFETWTVDRAARDGVPVTSPTRTIIDLAATVDSRRLTDAFDSAVRDRSTTEDFLHLRLTQLRTRGRPGIGKLLDVLAGIDAGRGGQSWLERKFLRTLAVAGVSRPDTQQVLARRSTRLVRVDCHFPGTNVVVELLGYTFHRTVMQMQADAERMNALLLAGQVPIQFTYEDVVRRPASMLGVLAAALQNAHRAPAVQRVSA